MKNILRVGLLLAGIFGVFGISGNAQVSNMYAAHIPFDFKVGDKVLKAGDYRISPLDGATNERVIVLRDSSTGKATLLGQTAIGSYGTIKGGRLTFIGSDDGWFLKEITTEGFTLKTKAGSVENQNVASAKKPVETQTVEINR